MKIITIQETKNGKGYVASINGFEGGNAIAGDEVTALRNLLTLIESKNPAWIQKQDFTWKTNTPEV